MSTVPKVGRWLIGGLALLGIFGVLGIGASAVAQAIPPDRHAGRNPVVDHLTRQLERAGVETSPDSLETAVRSHDSASIRSLAAYFLGRQGASRSIPVLLDVSRNDPDDTVRLAATSALCKLMSDAECVVLLGIGFDAARSPAEALPWGRQLAAKGDPRSIPVYQQLLEDPATRHEAMRSLSYFLALREPDFEPRALLAEWLVSDDPEVRSIAVNESALGLLAGTLELAEVESTLEALTRDEDPDIRRQAEAALLHGRQKQAEQATEPNPSNLDPENPSDEDPR